jgi:aspartate aminotransferase
MLKISRSLSNLGTESAFEVLAKATELSQGGKNIINLGIGQPDFRTPDHIVEAGIKALKDGHHGYTPTNGILALREAVANDIYRRHNVSIDPNTVVVMPGGKPTMFFTIMMFGGPGTEIMYPNPGFPIYESLINFTGAKAVPINLREDRDFSFDADEVLQQITSKTTLIIINSPANPTGGITSKKELEKLVNGISEHPSIAVLSDEIYSRLIYDGVKHTSLLQYPEIKDQVIMLDGWSKKYAMTGWRLGYGVWPKKLVPHITRLCINNHSCVNAATQHAGIAALNGPQDAVEEMLNEFNNRRTLICSELNSIPNFNCNTPGGAFYAFPNITRTGLSSQKAQDHFLEHAGVATIAGTSFGSSGEGFLRFSYASSADNIREAVKRIKGSL